MMPGAFMYRVESPLGIPSHETDVARQLRMLVDSKVFSAIPQDKREVLIQSVAATLARADYHFQRFLKLRARLDETRAWAPGDVFWDATVSPIHFELQAQAGAARALLDELVYLVAARHTKGGKFDKEKWAVWRLYRRPVSPGSPTDVPEVHRMKANVAWFDMLNAYRNKFFHSGWLHGSGHYFRSSRQIWDAPQRNALLVPDQSSLTSSSKPYDWTWNDGTTVDDVARRVHEGAEALVSELCELEWGTPMPKAGTMPKEEHPNLVIILPRPVLLMGRDAYFLPLFSTREKADALLQMLPGLAARARSDQIELIETRSTTDVDGVEAIHFSTQGLSEEPPLDCIRACVDPEPPDGDWGRIDRTLCVDMPLTELLNNKMKFASIEMREPMTIFVWRTALRTEGSATGLLVDET